MTDPLRVPVPGRPEAGYEVRIGRGSLDRLGARLSEAVPAHRYAVVSDSRVAELYGRRALEALAASGLTAELFTFPAGEWNKTRPAWARLTDAILASGLGRDGAVVALGGGVTGDLAGFVAATYMRGVPVAHVPTTLLAMVDSAVGGKTGVDTEAGKNLVGAFHHPALVVADPELLGTLPKPQLAAGLAEVVKAGAILDAPFLAWIEEHAEALLSADSELLEAAVRRAVAHKVEVVAADPAETGVRAILNFGHTVGHALELLHGYEVLHGEAVAAGMRAEARLGEAMGVTEAGTARRLARALEACRLDLELEERTRPDAVWEAAASDKKRRGGRTRCVLLRRVGEVARSPDGGWSFELSADTDRQRLARALRPVREDRD